MDINSIKASPDHGGPSYCNMAAVDALSWLLDDQFRPVHMRIDRTKRSEKHDLGSPSLIPKPVCVCPEVRTESL